MSVPAGIEQFAPPPRNIGALLAARMMAGSALSQIGWLVLGFGSIFFWGIAWYADLSGPRFTPAATSQTRGAATDCRPTHLTVKGSKYRRGTPVYEIRYRYEVDGRGYTGSSYAVGYCLAAGPAVVEYLVNRPAISRIVSMRRRPLGPAAVVVGIVPLVGLVLVGFGLRHGRRYLTLLRDGLTATGRLIDQTRTNIQTNNRYVYRMTFEYTAQTGAKGQVVARTNQPSRYENKPAPALFYDPANLRRAILLDSLPGTIFAGEGGQPAARGPALFLILPAMAVAGNVWYVYAHFVGG